MNQEILSSSAVSEGTWHQIDHLIAPFTVTVYGFAAGDTAQIYISDLYDKPAAVAPASADGTFKYGGDISGDTATEITGSFRWLRVRKSVAGGAPATTKARVFGQEKFSLCPV